MKKHIIIIYFFACVYEVIKIFYIASFAANIDPHLLFFKYSALAALCIPAIPWIMLLAQENAGAIWLYAQSLIKILSICGEFLYIFHRGFVIINNVVNAAHNYAGSIKVICCFLALDTVLLFFAYIKGSMSYANHTDC